MQADASRRTPTLAQGSSLPLPRGNSAMDESLVTLTAEYGQAFPLQKKNYQTATASGQ
jgi:hypothetical protein